MLELAIAIVRRSARGELRSTAGQAVVTAFEEIRSIRAWQTEVMDHKRTFGILIIHVAKNRVELYRPLFDQMLRQLD
jgi:hypothetical protein